MQHIARGWSDLDSDHAESALLGLSFSGGFGAASGFSRLDYLIERFSHCPWPATVGSMAPHHLPAPSARRSLYTAEERRRRDSTSWTLVQGILAPIQFLVFAVSVWLVLNYLATGNGYGIATASIVVKTFLLYTIMITGAIWEKRVFGRYLFAPSFYWEDVFSMLVLALHSAYLLSLVAGWGSADGRMMLALAAYAAYLINATQFVMKLRAARLEAPRGAHGAGQGD